MSEEVHISAQVTPNPNTLKLVVDRNILDFGSIDFPDNSNVAKSPLVAALFEIEGMEGVLVGVNFISVTKAATMDWSDLAEAVISTIKGVFAQDEGLVDPALMPEKPKEGEESEAIQKIKKILDEEIRPAVAMDGGDIIYDHFNEADGKLYLQLQGACSSCPSSVMTLKMGIETRLKEDIPQLAEVIQSS